MKYLLTIVLALTLTACGSSSDDTTPPVVIEPEPPKVIPCYEYTLRASHTVLDSGVDVWELTKDGCDTAISTITAYNNIVLTVTRDKHKNHSDTTEIGSYDHTAETIRYITNDFTDVHTFMMGYEGDSIEYRELQQLRKDAIFTMQSTVQLY